MLARLPAPLRGAITGGLLGLNTLVVFSLMVPPALVKRLVPELTAQALVKAGIGVVCAPKLHL